MQTLFGPTLQHKYKLTALLLSFLLLLTCCSREELEVVNLQYKVETQVYPVEKSKLQLLSLSFAVNGDPSQKQVHIVAGNQVSSWILTVKGDEQNTYTVGPLTMGSDVMLPEGEWKLFVLNGDGQTLEETFHVVYPMPRDIVVYDAATSTLHLTEGSALLSLYDAEALLLETRQMERGSSITLEEGIVKAVVKVLDQEVTYIINR